MFWRGTASRIHGELLKLGIDVAERTVSRLLPKRRTPPSQTWRTFLANHVRDLVSLDFFIVPTARLRVLFVLVVLAHHRRHVVHFNVTEHPRSWTPSQTTPRRAILSFAKTLSGSQAVDLAALGPDECKTKCRRGGKYPSTTALAPSAPQSSRARRNSACGRPRYRVPFAVRSVYFARICGDVNTRAGESHRRPVSKWYGARAPPLS